MIEIQIRSAGDWAYELEIQGHAGDAEKGFDIVCAAVSVLSENLEDSLRTLLALDPDTKSSAGYHRIRLRNADSRAEMLFAAATLGLNRLALERPDRIVLKVKKEKGNGS